MRDSATLIALSLALTLWTPAARARRVFEASQDRSELTVNMTAEAAASAASQQAIIRGTILGLRSRSAAGVLVQLVRDSIAPPYDTIRTLIAIDTTDSIGHFSFGPLPAARYQVTAESHDHIAGARGLSLGATDTLTLELQLLNTGLDFTAIARRAKELERLTAARALWASRKPARYRLTVKIDCFCPPRGPATFPLEFVNDSVAGVDSRGRWYATRDQPYREIHIDSLFARVELSIRRFDMPIYRVEYDSSYGFPAVIDHAARRLHDRDRFEVVDFHALP
jgi:hypothetical protein